MATVPAPRLDPTRIRALRQDVQAASWTTDTVSALLSQRAQDALDRDQLVPASVELARQTSAAATLTRLFILADPVSDTDLLLALPTLGAEGAVILGLVAPDEEQGRGRIYRALVDLRPHGAQFNDQEHQWWIASDLSQAQTGLPPTEDHVLGIASATTNLLRQTMRTPVDSALDLGCGSGILALYLTAHSRTVVATDISERACEFTRFNALLNEVEIDVRQGSLFDPVSGDRFDLITSNPPFVITPEAVRQRINLDYRDGGLPRDSLIPKIIAEGLAHLNDGGALQMLANWEVGAREDRWDRRPVRWIQEAAAPLLALGCSVAAWIVQRDLVDVAQYAEWWMRDQWGDRVSPKTWKVEYREWLSDFARAGTSYVGLGSIVLRRGNVGDHGELRLEAEYLPNSNPLDGCAVATALSALRPPNGWRSLALRRSRDVREVRYYVPGSADPELVRLTQGAPGGRDRSVTAAVAAFVGVCDGQLSADQVVPAIALLMSVEEDEVWDEIESALPELLRSGVLSVS